MANAVPFGDALIARAPPGMRTPPIVTSRPVVQVRLVRCNSEPPSRSTAPPPRLARPTTAPAARHQRFGIVNSAAEAPSRVVAKPMASGWERNEAGRLAIVGNNDTPISVAI